MRRAGLGGTGILIATLAGLLPALGGCDLEASFLRTASDFVPSARQTRPAVFLERRPTRPYRSVGLILVAGRRLEDVVVAAVEKGMEVGCDLIVDRRVHGTGQMRPEDNVRWVLRVDDAELRVRRAEAEGPAPTSHSALPLNGNLLGQAITTTYVNTAPPPPEREFICGLYTEDSTGSAVHNAPTNDAMPPTSALWDLVVGDRSGKAACNAAKEMLAHDESCEREQCGAPLVLAGMYISRCGADNAADASVVRTLESRWKAQASGVAAGPCFGHLMRALRSTKAATRFKQECLHTRSAGHLETAIVNHAFEGLDESER